MGFNLSAADSILKNRYLGTIREQLNNATVLFSRLEKRIQMVSGKNFTVPLHTTRNSSAARGIDDGGVLPTAGQQGYTTTVVPNKYLYGRIQVTGPTIAATRDNVGAFAEALESEVDGLTRDFKRFMNRQLHSDGTDALAYTTGADDITPATVDDGQGNAFIHLDTGTNTVDIYDVSALPGAQTKLGDSIPLVLGAKGATNYSVSWASGTIAGTADGDIVVLEDSFGKQLMGIRGIVDDADPPLGPLQALPVASNEFWKAQVFGNGGVNRALAFEDMQEVIDSIATQTDYSESDINLMLSNFPQRREYFKLCVAERRQVNTMNLDGGWKSLEFNGIPYVADSQCRRNVIYFLVLDTMSIYRTSDFDWMDKDGSYLSRVANADAYEATLFHYGNLACLSRNGNGLLEDLSET